MRAKTQLVFIVGWCLFAVVHAFMGQWSEVVLCLLLAVLNARIYRLERDLLETRDYFQRMCNMLREPPR